MHEHQIIRIVHTSCHFFLLRRKSVQLVAISESSGGNKIAHLILVRHAISQQQPGVSSHTWGLTDEGRVRCLKLAEQLRHYQPELIVTSAEPKAIQTGQAVAKRLDLPIETDSDLGEHRRSTATYFASEQTFRATIRELLTQPDTLIFGEETGTQAYTRFHHAINTILSKHAEKTMIVVTHGTVMSLFLAQVAGVEPVSFWEGLGMPAYIVLELPGFKVVKQISEVK